MFAGKKNTTKYPQSLSKLGSQSNSYKTNRAIRFPRKPITPLRYNRFNRFPRLERVTRGKRLYFEVRRTNNNIVFKISHFTGGPLFQSTAGALGMQGSRRDSPTSAEIATRRVLKRLEPFSERHITFILVGPFDRVARTIIKTAEGSGVIFSTFKFRQPATHNGVRRRKPRRV